MDQPAFDDIIASVWTEPEFPNPEARYQFERAHAEEQFRRDYEIWETANRENPPRVEFVSSIPGGPESVWKTDARDEAAIASSLRHWIGVFLDQELRAYGDLLLSKGTPGSEAVLSFEQHADELLNETFTRKWLYGLRRGELSETEFSERFWVLRSGTVARSRHEFEGRGWKADVDIGLALPRVGGPSGPALPANASITADAAPAEAAGPPREAPTASPEQLQDAHPMDDRADRRAAVDAYIEECRKAGKRVTRTDIWKKAGYKSRTEFERWERNDPNRPNKSAHERFTGILAEKPHLK